MYGKLIVSNIKRRPWQSGLTIFVVGTCTAALITCFLLVWAIERGGEGAVNNLGADVLVIPANADFEPGQVLFMGAPANIYMEAKVVEEIKKIPGVEEASAQFFSQTLNQSCCSLPGEYRLVGYDPDSDFLVNKLIAKGVRRHMKPNEVIVGGKVPAFLGDRVVILEEPFDVAGYLEPMGGSLDKAIFIPIETGRRLAAQSPYLQDLWLSEGKPDDLISAVLIKTSEGAKPEQVARDITKISGVKGVASAKLFLDLKEQLIIFKAILWGFVMIISSITISALLSRYSSIVMERQDELALLRALGTNKKMVFNLVVLETIFISLLAIVPGCFVAWGLVLYLEKLISKYSAFPFLLPSFPESLAAIFGISFIVALISTIFALWPAGASARIDPAVVLARGNMR